MTSFEFIKELARRRVFLANDAGTLKYHAPEGAVDEQLKAMLRRFKGDLIKALDEHHGYLLICPLSYNQQSLFFMHLLEPDSASYNVALTMKFLSPVNTDILKSAVEKVVQRHGQLRTTFGHIELGDSLTAVQFVHDELPFEFETIEAQHWPEHKLTEETQKYYRKSFNLERGPMVRAGLFLRGDGGPVFILVLHHVISDALSLNQIMRDLASAYRGELEVNEEQAAGMEYVDFALAQRRDLEETSGKSHLDYWLTTHKSPAPVPDLKHNGKRPAMRRSVGATHYFDLDAETCARIEKVAQEQGITTFALLLSVFQWFLYERSGQRDVSIGVPVMARSDRRFENTVGYFINPVPLRSSRSEKYSFSSHARETAGELLKSLDHRDAPFAAIVEQLGGVRDTSYTPLFQVMFNMLSRKTLGDVIDLLYPVKGPPIVDFGGFKATAYPVNQQEGQFDLTLELVDKGDSILGLLKYCTDMFSDSEAAEMATSFQDHLHRVLARPDIDIFTAAERKFVCTELEGDIPIIAISASFTAEVLQEFMEFWFERLQWPNRVKFAQFNQVFQELLNPSSLLRSNRRGHNVVIVRLDDLLEGGPESLKEGNGADTLLSSILDELFQAVASAVHSMPVPLCFTLCPSSPKTEDVLHSNPNLQVRVDRFLEGLRSLPGVTVLTHEDIHRRYPIDDYYEPFGEEIGHIPFTRLYFSALATSLVRSLHVLSRKPVKALAIDCDGTLWQGVVGEDGPTGVTVGPWQRAFQNFLLEQHKAGVVLCLCSKNQEADVWAVFDNHPDMVLRREHILFLRINWEPKSANIRSLAKEMNFGLDAIAFLDDNPLERAEVASRCPSVLCLGFPDAWEDRTAWLQHAWVLDHGRVTAEDRKRQEQYRTDHLRDTLKKSAGSLHDFLEKLELKISLNPAKAADYERLAQLSMRTNQFNTTTLRLTIQEVAEYAEGPEMSAHVARVSDRFGDYGLVGAMLARVVDDVLRVEGMFLSCRALGRGVEHRMAAYMGSVAQEAKCTNVAFPLRVTERNEPARTFLAQLADLSNGTLDHEGTLIASVGQLLNVRYEPAEVAGDDDALDAQEPPVNSEQTSFQDRELLLSVAGELGTIEKILDAAEARTRAMQKTVLPQTSGGPAVPARTDTERLIADAWKRVLGLAEVNTHARFFEVGGTSLLMARIAIELKRNYGLEVSITNMFQYPTITDLAAYLDNKGPVNHVSERVEASAVRQRQALNAKNLPDAFRRLKNIRG